MDQQPYQQQTAAPAEAAQQAPSGQFLTNTMDRQEQPPTATLTAYPQARGPGEIQPMELGTLPSQVQIDNTPAQEAPSQVLPQVIEATDAELEAQLAAYDAEEQPKPVMAVAVEQPSMPEAVETPQAPVQFVATQQPQENVIQAQISPPAQASADVPMPQQPEPVMAPIVENVEMKVQPVHQEAPAVAVEAPLVGTKRPLLLPIRRTSDHELIYTEANIYQVAFLHKNIVGKFRLELEDFTAKKLDERKAKVKKDEKKEAAIAKKEAAVKAREEEKIEKNMQLALEKKKAAEQAAFEKAQRAQQELQVAQNQVIQRQANVDATSQNIAPLDAALDQAKVDGQMPEGLPGLAKQVSRSSNRVLQHKQPNYAQINDGQGPLSNSMNYDPNEVAPTNGANPAAATGPISQAQAARKDIVANAKKRGYNLKSDVHFKCLEILKVLHSNDKYKLLLQVAAQPFKEVAPSDPNAPVQQPIDDGLAIDNEIKKKLLVVMDNLDQGMEKKLNDFQYQTGIAFTIEVQQNLSELMRVLGPVPSLSNIPTELWTFFDLTCRSEKPLVDKEIFSIDTMKAPGMTKITSAVTVDPGKDKLMKQMANELMKAQKKIDGLENQVRKVNQKKKPTSIGTKTPSLAKAPSSETGKAEIKAAAPVQRNEPLNPADQKFIESNIADLNQQQKNGIFDIVKDCLQGDEAKDDVIEFELDQLPPERAHQLKDYMMRCLKENSKKQRRREADIRRRQAKKEEQARQNGQKVPTQPEQMAPPQNNQPKKIAVSENRRREVPKEKEEPVAQPVQIKPTQPQQPAADPSALAALQAQQQHQQQLQAQLLLQQQQELAVQTQQNAANAIFENMDNAQLSTLLQQHPTLQISDVKRQQVELYRAQQNLLLQQMLQQQQQQAAAAQNQPMAAPQMSAEQMQLLIQSMQQKPAQPAVDPQALLQAQILAQVQKPQQIPQAIPQVQAQVPSQPVVLNKPNPPAQQPANNWEESSSSSSDSDDYDDHIKK